MLHNSPVKAPNYARNCTVKSARESSRLDIKFGYEGYADYTDHSEYDGRADWLQGAYIRARARACGRACGAGWFV